MKQNPRARESHGALSLHLLKITIFSFEQNCQMFRDLEPGYYLLCCWVTSFSSSLYVVSLDQKPLQEKTVSLDCICIVPVMWGSSFCLSIGRTGPLHFRRKRWSVSIFTVPNVPILFDLDTCILYRLAFICNVFFPMRELILKRGRTLLSQLRGAQTTLGHPPLSALSSSLLARLSGTGLCRST